MNLTQCTTVETSLAAGLQCSERQNSNRIGDFFLRRRATRTGCETAGKAKLVCTLLKVDSVS